MIKDCENGAKDNNCCENSLSAERRKSLDPALISAVRSYIERFYVNCEELNELDVASAKDEAPPSKSIAPRMIMCESAAPFLPQKSARRSLHGIFDDMDKSFSEMLFYYIDQKGITDVEAYKLSNVDKKTFSKIKCNPDYRPSKITAVSFAIGLHLSIGETNRLLRTAGMCLSRSNKFDLIIKYFITSGNYKTIFDVNDVLYEYDQSTLGTLE